MTHKAITLYEDFTGQEADDFQTIEMPDVETAIVIGELESIIYKATRDGITELYQHDFDEKGTNNAPILAVSDDGRQLLIIGGNYVFTDHGIED